MNIDKVDQQLNETYDRTMRFMDESLKDTDTQMVASTMLAIAFRLYKSVLSKEDYAKFVEAVAESAINVRPFERPTFN